jgi:hypothetical protein
MISDPCLKKLLEKAKTSNVNGTIEDIIKKLDGNAKVKINVSDKEEVLSNGIVVEGKATDYTYRDGTFSCSILLNKGVLSNSTQEYSIGTIIHETVHAYLQYEAGNTDKHGTNHDEMAKSYVNSMSDYLLSLFPRLTSKDATAIAWGGLQGTELWTESKKNDTFTYEGGQSMTYIEMARLLTAHRFGYADKGTSACAN